MEIKKFSEIDSEILNRIINKHFTHWSHFSSSMDLKDTQEKFRNLYAINDNIPFGIALLEDNNLIGFCVLKMECLKKYSQFFPWISDVMIFDEFRGKGYGKIMIDEALKILAVLGYEQAYLWTDQAPEFYQKIGFTYLQQVEKNEGGFGQLFCKKTK